MTLLDEVKSSEFRRLGVVAARVQDVGHGREQPLSVFLTSGVVPRSSRSDNHNELGSDLEKYQLVEAGDLVFNRLRAWQGGFGSSAYRGIVSPAYIVARPIGADSRYLNYVLHSAPYMAELVRISKWMPPSQFDVLWSDLRQIPVPWVALHEQVRIADFLDDRVSRIDQIIASRRKQLELEGEWLRERLRSVVAGAEGTDSDRVCPELPWISRIGADARPLALARVLTLQRGVDLTEDERRPGDAAVITTAGQVGTHTSSICPGPGVVIGRYGTVGNVHWVDGPFWPHNTTLYVKRVHGNSLKWIYYLLRAFPFEAMQARAAIPGINRNDLATELVPWIPPKSQFASAKKLDDIFDDEMRGRLRVENSIALLDEYKRSLITAAVTSELDVTTAGSGIKG